MSLSGHELGGKYGVAREMNSAGYRNSGQVAFLKEKKRPLSEVKSQDASNLAEWVVMCMIFF